MLYTTREASEMIGISQQYLLVLIKERKIIPTEEGSRGNGHRFSKKLVHKIIDWRQRKKKIESEVIQ